MSYDLDDTIVALASAPGAAARGVIRLSGPRSLECVASCFIADAAGQWPVASGAPRRLSGAVRITLDDRLLTTPCHLLAWPSTKTYTRQPSAELHLLGSPPLIAAVVDKLVCCGARPAAPGEFTLRAFLGGRLDLTQAEGVLGAVDARSRADLDAALNQLAGGLSRPLHRLREELLAILAELEAGLDFADEDVEFISRDAITAKLAEAQVTVDAALKQLRARDNRAEALRVVLTGPPNAGKSRLFNALVARFGPTSAAGQAAQAIVSPIAGATRDYLVARLELDGVICELVDTAGEIEFDSQMDSIGAAPGADPIQRAAQSAASAHRRGADLRLICAEVSVEAMRELAPAGAGLRVATKCDLHPASAMPTRQDAVHCSAATGAGLEAVAQAIAARLRALGGDSSAAASTVARCTGSLRDARRALVAATALAGADAGADELISAELRAALDALGEVVGAICADDVLDRVFSQFCIGK